MLPENNGPAKVFKITNCNVNDTHYNGYCIEIQDVDIRFMHGDTPHFEAWNLGHEVFLKMPAASYTFLFDSATEKAGKAMANLTASSIEETMDTDRNAMIKRMYKYFLFKFPESLDNDPFSPDALDGKINVKVVPLTSRFESADLNGNMVQLTSYRVNLSWHIAIYEEDKRKIKTKKGGNELANQMATLVSGMKIA